MSNNLVDAFAHFGAEPKSRLRGRSAIATDGSLVLSCSIQQFQGGGSDVLRYEDTLSRDPGNRLNSTLLGEHLELARSGRLPIRMVVVAQGKAGKTRFNIYPRPDVIGQLIEFDGDRFIVDFARRADDLREHAAAGRTRRG